MVVFTGGPLAQSWSHCIVLIDSCFELLCGDLILLNDMNDSTPTCQTVTILCVEQSLRRCLEEIVRVKVGLPQRFTHSVELFFTRTGYYEILWCCDTTNQIGRCNVRLEGLRLETSNNGLHKVWPEPPSIEEIRHNLSKCSWRDFSILTQLIQVGSKLCEVGYGLDVRCQTRQPKVEMITHLEHLFEVECDGLKVDTVTQITGNSNAILACHGQNGGSIV